MKLFPALLASAALSAGATAGLLEILSDPAPARASAEPSAAEPAQASEDGVARPTPKANLVAAGTSADADRVRQLEDRVAQLERQLLQTRRPVEVATTASPQDVASLDPEDPAARQLVLDVIAAEEARERAEREARQAQERLESLQRRADRITEKIGLAPAHAAELIEVWLSEDEQREAARDQMRGQGFDSARETFQAIEDWTKLELERRFGIDVAAAIQEADPGDRNRGGRGGRGGR